MTLVYQSQMQISEGDVNGATQRLQIVVGTENGKGTEVVSPVTRGCRESGGSRLETNHTPRVYPP
jgi:hypothetical protein